MPDANAEAQRAYASAVEAYERANRSGRRRARRATSSPPRRSSRRAATRCCGRARCSPGARRRSAARRASSTRATARPRATSPGARRAGRRVTCRPARPTPSASTAASRRRRASSSATVERVPFYEAGPAFAPFYSGFFPGLLIGSMVAGGWDNPTPSDYSGSSWSGRRRFRRRWRRGRLRRRRRRRGRLRWRQLLGARGSPARRATRGSPARRGSARACSPAWRSPRPCSHWPPPRRPERRVGGRGRVAADPVYVDPGAELAGQVDAAALRARIDAQGAAPLFIAVLPESAIEGSAGRTLIALREAVGESGDLRAGRRRRVPHDPGRRGRGRPRRRTRTTCRRR